MLKNRLIIKVQLVILFSFLLFIGPHPVFSEISSLLKNSSTKGVPGVGFDSPVSTLSVQPDGKILVGGNFTSFFAEPSGQGLTRLNSDGTLDIDFVINFQSQLHEAYVSSLLIQPDEKIVFGGVFKKLEGEEYALKSLGRVDFLGNVDRTFPRVDPEIDGVVEALAQNPKGDIFVGGNFSCGVCEAARGLLKISSQGNVDRAFQVAIGTAVENQGSVETILVREDGKIILAGGFTKFNGKKVDGLVRLLPDGTFDLDFLLRSGRGYFHGFTFSTHEEGAEDFGPFIPHAVMHENGQFILSGEFMTYGDDQKIFPTRVIRFDVEGNLDLPFAQSRMDYGFRSDVNSLLVQRDGTIFVGCDQPFSKLNADGTQDQEFLTGAGSALIGAVNAMAEQPDGKIILGGEFPSYIGVQVGNVARIHPDGTLDEDFTTNNYR